MVLVFDFDVDIPLFDLEVNVDVDLLLGDMSDGGARCGGLFIEPVRMGVVVRGDGSWAPETTGDRVGVLMSSVILSCFFFLFFLLSLSSSPFVLRYSSRMMMRANIYTEERSVKKTEDGMMTRWLN